MARRAMNALQLALGSVGSGIQGYTQARAQREAQDLEAQRYAAEQERLQKAEARQAERDAAQIRSEQREIATTPGFVTAERLASMTMPGATPLASMQPTMRQKVGDQEYVYAPGVAEAERHRAAIEQSKVGQSIKKAELKEKSDRIKTLYAQARKDGPRSEAAALLAAEDKDLYNVAFPAPKGTGLSELQRLNRADEIDRAVAWYNAGERDPQKRADIGATYRRLRAANPNRPAPELLLMTYNAFKDREASDYKRAQTGKLEASGGDQLAGLLAPATASNPALEEERRAYDESVAKYGMDLVRSRFGPRP